MFSFLKRGITPEEFGAALCGFFCMAMDAEPRREDFDKDLDGVLVEREKAYLISAALAMAAQRSIRDDAARDRAVRAFARRLEVAMAAVGGAFSNPAYEPRLKEYLAAWESVDAASAVGATFARALGRPADPWLSLYGTSMFADSLNDVRDLVGRRRLRG